MSSFDLSVLTDIAAGVAAFLFITDKRKHWFFIAVLIALVAVNAVLPV